MIFIGDLALKKMRKRKKSITVGKAIKPPLRAEVNLRRSLIQLQTDVLDPKTSLIVEGIKSGISIESFKELLEEVQNESTNIYKLAAFSIVNRWISLLSNKNKALMEKSLSGGLCFRNVQILDNDKINEAIKVFTLFNLEKIKSIPRAYFAEISKAVYNNYIGINQVGNITLFKRLRDIGRITKGRAKFLARDQTSKLNSVLTQIRQLNAGIEKFIWRTALDRRVVGTPDGLYPKGNEIHNDHYKRNGKVFYLDKLPEDGAPGYAPGCRCVAIAVIDSNKVLERSIGYKN